MNTVSRTKLSDRIGPQDNVTVPVAAPASVGANTTSDPTSHAVLVEDIQDVACTVKNTGPNPLASLKIQTNEFSPAESDSRWVDDPALVFAALGPGAQQTVPVQGNTHRWMRLVAQNTVADGPISIAWTGQ